MDEKTVEIAVNKEFAWVLNELNVTFTAFELKEFISLKSSYAKEFYRRMKQFKSTGKWNISLEDFKRIMDVPVNYRMCDIDVWVLKPIQKELGDKFKLKIKKIYSKKSRGRPSVSGFEFTFSNVNLNIPFFDYPTNKEEINTTGIKGSKYEKSSTPNSTEVKIMINHGKENLKRGVY